MVGILCSDRKVLFLKTPEKCRLSRFNPVFSRFLRFRTGTYWFLSPPTSRDSKAEWDPNFITTSLTVQGFL